MRISRLSVEDAAYGSDSVENQREMLSMFIDQMPGCILHRCYVDNGYPGANFQRPGFLEMMEDVRNKGVVAASLLARLQSNLTALVIHEVHSAQAKSWKKLSISHLTACLLIISSIGFNIAGI